MKPELAISSYLDRHGYKELRPKVVLFDMDGVLFDSMPFHAAAWMKVFEEEGIPFAERDAYMNEGRTGVSTICEFFMRYKRRMPTEEEKRRIYERKCALFNELSVTRRIVDVDTLLRRLKADGKGIYVVTGSGQRSLTDRLEHYFPGMFCGERMVTAYDVKRGKPDPEPYLMALGKAAAAPYRAAVVENSPLGVKSGSAAGIFTIAVNTGKLDEKALYSHGADIVFPDMASLNREYDIIFQKHTYHR